MAGAGCGLLGLVAEGLTRQGPANFDIRPFVRVPQEGPTSFFLCIGFSKELESLFGGARFWSSSDPPTPGGGGGGRLFWANLFTRAQQNCLPLKGEGVLITSWGYRVYRVYRVNVN